MGGVVFVVGLLLLLFATIFVPWYVAVLIAGAGGICWGVSSVYETQAADLPRARKATRPLEPIGILMLLIGIGVLGMHVGMHVFGGDGSGCSTEMTYGGPSHSC